MVSLTFAYAPNFQRVVFHIVVFHYIESSFHDVLWNLIRQSASDPFFVIPVLHSLVVRPVFASLCEISKEHVEDSSYDVAQPFREYPEEEDNKDETNPTANLGERR